MSPVLETPKSTIKCPKCGSAKVRKDLLKRINIGGLLLDALAIVAVMEMPHHFARVCRECGHRFVN